MSSSGPYCDHCGASNPPQAAFCFACGQSLQGTRSMTGLLVSGSLLKQRYRLLDTVGKGGFGAVYKTEDTQLSNRLVAVKEMSQQGLTPLELQKATDAFQREGVLLARLQHPSLPAIYEHFREAGRWYLVMEWIAGETLEARLTKASGGHILHKEALQIGVQLCDVLAYLHTRQPPIIFRDLKPSNVMLTPDGHLFLIDFGIARFFKPGQAKDTIAFGSPGYAAPEQYGKAQTTPQSDIYSLGTLLHQMLSGHDPSTNQPLLWDFPVLPSQVPTELAKLVEQMLQPRPEDRPASIAIVKPILQGAAAGNATTKQVETTQTPVAPPAAPVQGASKGSAGSSASRSFWHTERVNTVAWSPDGALLASGGFDGIAQVWSVRSGDSLVRYSGHAKYVNTVAWSPDGKQIASGSADGTVHLWEATTGKKLLSYEGHSNWVLGVAWSPDGQQIASSSWDGTVQVWKARTGERMFTYHGHSGLVRALAWSPDGNHLASGGNDGTVQVTSSGNAIFTYRGHTGRVHTLGWSPDGKRIASGGEDRTIQIWDALSGSKVQSHRAHTRLVTSLAWSPDGKRIASGGEEKSVRIWDAITLKTILTSSDHSDVVWSVAWSPDGAWIASASSDKTIKVWRSGSGSARKVPLQSQVRHPRSWGASHQKKSSPPILASKPASSPSSQPVITVSPVAAPHQTHKLSISSHTAIERPSSAPGQTKQSLTRRKVLRSLGCLGLLLVGGGGIAGGITWLLQSGSSDFTYQMKSTVNGVAWSSNSKRIVSVCDDGAAQVWDAANGDNILYYRDHGTTPVNTVAWRADSTHLAIGLDNAIFGGAEDHVILIWDGVTGKTLLTCRGHNDDVLAVAWAPDGSRFTSGSEDHTAKVWDATTGTQLLTYKGHSDDVRSVAWSPDGARIASASKDQTVQVWEVATGTRLFILRSHTDAVNSVAWSPDGQRIASGSDDQTVRVWDALAGTALLTFRGHTAAATAVAWSPDGRQIASAGGYSDRTVQVWSPDNVSQVYTYTGHKHWYSDDGVNAVAWSPNGRQIASGGQDASVQVWTPHKT